MPIECLCQVLLSFISISILVQVVTILVIPRRIATLRAGLVVTLLLEQLLNILLVIGGGAYPDLLVVVTAAGSVGGNTQVVSIQPRDDLQHGLRAADQVRRDLGADAVRPAPMLPQQRIVHMEEQCLDGDAHLGLSDALDQIFHGLVVPIEEAGWCCRALPRLHWRSGGRAGARPLPGLIVPLLAGVEGASARSIYTTLSKGYQEDQDPHAVRCTEAAQ